MARGLSVVSSCPSKRTLPAARRHQLKDTTPQSALARAALADQAQRLARCDGEAHVAERMQQAGRRPKPTAAQSELLGEPADLEQSTHGAGSS